VNGLAHPALERLGDRRQFLFRRDVPELEGRGHRLHHGERLPVRGDDRVPDPVPVRHNRHLELRGAGFEVPHLVGVLEPHHQRSSVARELEPEQGALGIDDLGEHDGLRFLRGQIGGVDDLFAAVALALTAGPQHPFSVRRKLRLTVG
jgi:hypothetical protein